MNIRELLNQRRRWLVLGLSACAVALGGPAAWTTGQEAAPAPAAADLLRAYPFDRITLLDNSTILVEPVSPRPLPPIDPEAAKSGRGGEPIIDPQGNIGLPGEPSRFKAFQEKEKERREKARGPDREITVHLAAEAATGRGDARDFIVKRAHIKKIEYFEDMLLAEGEALAKTRKYNQAFERYLRVQARNPKWPGLADHVDGLLFTEGRDALRDGEGERGLRLLRELLARRRDYPGLLDEISTAYAARINRAFDLKLYPLARRVLHELEQLAPEHAEVAKLRRRFEVAAKALADRGAFAASSAEQVDALTDALRVWPTLEGAEARYTAAFEALPTLDVAVVDVSSPPGPWVRSPADARAARLVYQPILADDTEDAKQGKTAGQIAAGLESTDLGRRLLIQVKPDIPWSDGSRAVSAVDVARSLIDRCDPRNPDKYQARWAELLEKVAPRDDRAVEIHLTRPLLKPSYWLGQPVGAAHAGPDGRIFVPQNDRLLVGDGLFVLAATPPGMIELRADWVVNQPTSSPRPKIPRLREFRYDRPAGAVAAFVRGDVALLAHVPPDQVPVLEAMADVKLGQYARPAVHVLALDGRNPTLRNRMARRALSYAVDRQGLLEETILKRAAGGDDAPADGVFARAGAVDAPGVAPLEHNPILAAALAALAKGELGKESLKLKLEYPAIAEVQAVVPRLVEAFRLARIEVEAVELPESQLESELRAGRPFEMAYRVLRSAEPVLDAGPMICPGYDAPPSAGALASGASPRIVQLLLQLDRAGEWPSANGIALQIDRELRDELPVIPLWQVADHYAWRGRLTGPAETADHLYQNIETWEIAPWVAKDPWISQ